MRLILVRHGETESNKYNGITDVPLSQKGYLHAEAVRQNLEKELIRKIYTSDLSRAIETAKIINLPHRVDLEIEPDLREINFGLWEGLSFSEIETQYKKQLEKWMEETINFRFPEGETLGELRKRVSRVLNKIKAKHKDETIVIVGHSGPIKIMLCETSNLDLSDFWKINIDLGSVNRIELGE